MFSIINTHACTCSIIIYYVSLPESIKNIKSFQWMFSIKWFDAQLYMANKLQLSPEWGHTLVMFDSACD